MDFSFDRAISRTAEGKALAAHPAFMDRGTPVSLYTPGKPREDALISQRQASHHSQAYGGRESIDWVYDCIGLYSDPISTAPYRLERPDGTKLVRVKTDGTPPEYQEGPEGLYKLLDKPNPFMLYDELVALLVIDLLLVGNHYWFKYNWDTPAAALYRLAPSHVKIKPGKYGPKKYIYQPQGVKDPLEIDPSLIVHFRRPNPHDAFYGMGVIQGAGRSMDLELALTDTVASYYENKADPSLIVQSERRVPRDVFNKLRAQLRARASGSKNAGELLVLEAGLKASSLSASASDALFADLGKMSRDRIFTKFRASPMLFGLMDESSGGNKVSDARREFDNYTLRPFMDKVQRMVTDAVTTGWDCKFIIDHRQILPAEEAIKAGESVAKIPGVKVREVRRMYEQFGIEESTGDPEIDNLVINVPGENMDEDGQGVDGGEGLADQPLGGEAGRPPKAENTAAFGVAGAQVREGKAVVGEDGIARTPLTGVRWPKGSSRAERPAPSTLDDVLLKLERKALAEEGKAVSTPAPDNRLPGEQRPDDTFSTARKSDIDGVTNFITAGLRDATVQLERDLLDHVEGKALKTSDLVSRIKKSPAWTTFKKQITEVLEEGARRAAASGVMHSGLTPEDDIDYDDIVKSVVHRPEGLRSIMSTLKDRVVKRIKDARDANAERHEYEAAVRAVVAEWADSQVVAIADSEATEAYNEGTLTAGEASGVDSWLVIEEDDAPDKPCQEAKDSIWDTATARANRKEHPRCRRAFLPLTPQPVAS